MLLLRLTALLRVAAAVESPVIGIFAQPTGVDQQYIAASYAKFVEMAGGRAMPLSYYASKETMEAWFDQINGVLFPGGAADLPMAAQFAVDYSIEKFESGGEIFPVWGTCLGFEWLAEACGGTLTRFQAENISLPLLLTEKAESSYLFRNAAVRALVAKEALTMNMHTQGVPPSEYEAGQPLGEMFDVLSTNVDTGGLTFVSTVEAKNGYPLYGVQWHPEKNAFETGISDDGTFYIATNHSADAVAVTFDFANSLMQVARKSTHAFQDPRTESAVLFNNCQTSTAKAPEFVESYFFSQDWDGSSPACPLDEDDGLELLKKPAVPTTSVLL